MAENTRPTTTTLEEAQEHGYLGTPVDQTPREEYTVAGQLRKAGSIKADAIITRSDIAQPNVDDASNAPDAHAKARKR